MNGHEVFIAFLEMGFPRILEYTQMPRSYSCILFHLRNVRLIIRDIAQMCLTDLQLLVQFQSGVTLLYCFWATPPEQRTENYDSPDVSDALRACSNILAIMADKWPIAECLRDVLELLAREVPLVDRPNRPPTRFSERSTSAVLKMLPKVRALVVHRSILRMIEEMISEDFPRTTELRASSARSSGADMLTSLSQQRQISDQDLPTQRYQHLPSASTFEMPFSTQMYEFSGTGVEGHEINVDELLSFPGMFEFDGWS
jgi:hypothetical protein